MMLAIYGPTQTGKTDLGINLSKKFNGEIISADSRQVYKKLDIGSGKISFNAKVIKKNDFWIVEGVKIHGFDIADPGITFTAADFIKFARAAIIRIKESNKLPIIVGGTGFYIKSLIYGIDTLGVPANPKLRNKLEKLSPDELYRKLLEVDSSRARMINDSDKKNTRRLIRAIEVALSKPIVQISSRSIIPQNELMFIGLTAPNDYLYKKADKWLTLRIKKGLIKEVKGLLDNDLSSIWIDNLGLEYRWISRYLLRKVNYTEAFNRLKFDIHSLIRRQKTFFNKFENIRLIDISKKNWQRSLEKTVKGWYTHKHG